MNLSEFEWSLILAVFGIISTLGGLAVAFISFFLKRTMHSVDDHGKAIQALPENYVTKADLEKTKTELRSSDKTDAHDKDINEIKRTYVTKDELKELKTEMRDETTKLAEDVKEIKDNYIRKDDFYRTTSDMSRQIDKVHNLLLQIYQEQGGKGNGQQ